MNMISKFFFHFGFAQYMLFSFFLFLHSCTNPSNQSRDITDIILNDRDNYFYLDTENYPANDKSLPIGVFDSGTGGLTVLDAIIKFDQHENESSSYIKSGDGKLDFQSEYFVYLGDQANMPYGNYSREDNVPLLKEHIIKDVQFLMCNKYYPEPGAIQYKSNKNPVKAIVIACNTATAYGKEDVEKLIEKAQLDIKVIGVIDAGVRGALSTLDIAADGTIGVMATAGTVSSQGYVNAIKKWSKKLGYTGKIDVFQQAGIGLAGAIDGSSDYISSDVRAPRSDYKGPDLDLEDARIKLTLLDHYGFEWSDCKILFEGKQSNPEKVQINSIENYIAYHVTTLIEKIRHSGEAKPLKAIILGCTHYPFYMEIFQKHFQRLYNFQENGTYIYRSFMSKEIALIDPAINTAKELYMHLRDADLFNNSDLQKSEFFISIPNDQNKEVELDSVGNFTYSYKYGRKAGTIQEYVKRVPFSRETLPFSTIKRLEYSVPLIFQLIRDFNQQNPKMSYLQDEDKI